MLDIRNLKLQAEEEKKEKERRQIDLCLEELEEMQEDLEKEIKELIIKGVTEYSLMPVRRFLADRGYNGFTINESIKAFFGGCEIKLKDNGDYYIII